uniref:Thioredoxin domain-containing protein n=1 Tax=Arcella intermedia TaxID=1963864 RepID=A0A6B2LAR5_9EUKA
MSLYGMALGLDKGEHVTELDHLTFQDLVEQRLPNKYYLLEFYSPICGACKKFTPEYALIGQYLRGVMEVGRMNIHPEEHKEIVSKFGVTGVPHVVLLPPGATGDSQVVPFEHFEGNVRTPISILKWICGFVEKLKLSEADIEDYLSLSDPAEVYPPRFLLIKESDTEMELYEALVATKGSEALFAEVEISKERLEGGWKMEVNGKMISQLPALVVLKGLHDEGGDGKEKVRFVYLEGNWLAGLQQFWDNIEKDITTTLEHRRPKLDLKLFTIAFFIMASSVLFILYYFNINHFGKNISEFTWGNSKAD